MSSLNLPDLMNSSKLTRKQAINLILTSLALEQISLSNILSAEGEKVQQFLKRHPGPEDFTEMNRGLERTLRNTIKSQMLLQFQLEDISDILSNYQVQPQGEDYNTVSALNKSLKKNHRAKSKYRQENEKVEVDEFDNEIEMDEEDD